MVRKFNIPYLKELGNRYYVEGQPEIFHVSADMLKMNTIDVILISNYDSFLGLPFYTETTGFNGKIYVTEIAYQYGKLLMEEMLEFMERIEVRQPDKNWKKEEVCGKFPNPPFQNPVEWRPFYTTRDMHSCLTKVITLSFNQTIDIFRLKVTPVVSGHTLGSAYWTIKTDNETIAYLSASNPNATDVKKMEMAPLRNVDYILATSISRLIDTTAQNMGINLIRTISDVLKNHGSVLLPMCPIGPIFELIEAVSDVIQSTNGISLDTPIYFISPVAKSAIAMASISAEWMSDSRQNAVYLPEEPYIHNNLIRSGRLKIYDSLYGKFSKEFRTPCVIFASHASLRVGDAAHMVEVLGSDPKNAVIVTDPDLPVEDVREPFRTLPIKFINIPMDFRMDFGTMERLLADMKPRYVLCSSFYTRPLVLRRLDLQIIYEKLWPIEYDETVQLAKLTKNKQKLVKVSVHPDVVSSLKFKQHPTRKVAIASVACYLSAYNDDFKLVPAKANIAKKKYGKITLSKVLTELRSRHLDVKQEENTKETSLWIQSLETRITFNRFGNRTKIQANKEENRQKILEIFKSFLVEDDGIVGRVDKK
uniref:Beta-Casp domain-containing protein n=1 Tax=Caenorhabditis tropicalis TaxID=1561998 RepID=A0A1I7TYF8_9PELO